jgi:hypothetical protein
LGGEKPPVLAQEPVPHKALLPQVEQREYVPKVEQPPSQPIAAIITPKVDAPSTIAPAQAAPASGGLAPKKRFNAKKVTEFQAGQADVATGVEETKAEPPKEPLKPIKMERISMELILEALDRNKEITKEDVKTIAEVINAREARTMAKKYQFEEKLLKKPQKPATANDYPRKDRRDKEAKMERPSPTGKVLVEEALRRAEIPEDEKKLRDEIKGSQGEWLETMRKTDGEEERKKIEKQGRLKMNQLTPDNYDDLIFDILDIVKLGYHHRCCKSSSG